MEIVKTMLPQNCGKFRKRNCGERAQDVSNEIHFEEKKYMLTLIVFYEERVLWSYSKNKCHHYTLFLQILCEQKS